jgi:crotonobetainyl-CoA:carnitine CoA-transferase CaiB-like acyl-CoA transferase
MKSVFDGLRLVDLSTGIAGPYAAMLLAEQGMDCVKMEPREGDPMRGLPGFAVWNRSKRGVALDVASQEGREAIHRLLQNADVLVESFSPGQAEALRLDYESLSAVNPRLVYCAIPPFGEKGPLREKPANEGVVAAFAGIMAGQGGLGFPPLYVTLPLASYGAALLTAYGAAAALYVREVTGLGQKVEVSLLAGAIAQQTAGFLMAETIQPVVPTRNLQQGGAAVYRLYECGDGQWMMLACGNQNFWNKLCIVLDRVDLAADPRFEGAPWSIADVDNTIALTDILAETFHQHPREHWLKLLGDADIPVAPVSRREEFMEDPQVRHNRMMIEVDDPHFGRTRQMGIPIELTENPGRVKGPAPSLGEHTRAVLAEIGYSDEEVRGLSERGVILA